MSVLLARGPSFLCFLKSYEIPLLACTPQNTTHGCLHVFLSSSRAHLYHFEAEMQGRLFSFNTKNPDNHFVKGCGIIERYVTIVG